MNQRIRMLVTAASLAVIAVAAKVDQASAIWECYTCTTQCPTYGPTACFLDCDGADFNTCFYDTIEWCEPGEFIVECGGEPD